MVDWIQVYKMEIQWRWMDQIESGWVRLSPDWCLESPIGPGCWDSEERSIEYYFIKVLGSMNHRHVNEMNFPKWRLVWCQCLEIIIVINLGWWLSLKSQFSKKLTWGFKLQYKRELQQKPFPASKKCWWKAKWTTID